MKFFIHLTILIICVLALFVVPENNLSAVTASVIAGILLLLLSEAIAYRAVLHQVWWCIRYRNTRIRLSFSYLFRIKVKDRYLLIKGQRIDQFQPVGGVFKRLPGSKEFFDGIGAVDDNLVPVDTASEGDLRVRIQGRHLLKFSNWFRSGEGRETCPCREFHEELVKPGLLSSGNFGHIFFTHVRNYSPGVEFSNWADGLELLHAEIFELELNKEQQAELCLLAKGSSPQLIWADETAIRRRGVVPDRKLDVRISRHSSWVL